MKETRTSHPAPGGEKPPSRAPRPGDGFFHQAFPTAKRAVVFGVGYGLLLSLLLWFPHSVDLFIPKWVGYLLLFLCLALAVGLYLSGRLFPQNRDYGGWYAIGFFAASLLFPLIPLGDGIETNMESGTFFIAGVIVLAVHLVMVLRARRQSN